MYQHFQSDNSYHSITDTGTTYIVEFDSASFYFRPDCNLCHRIESISFQPVGLERQQYDIQICETIVDIIRVRCQQTLGAILFICDSSDSRGRCRAKLFETWYNTQNGEDYHFQASIVEYSTVTTYAGLIVPIANPDALSFLDEFSSVIDLISAKE